MIVERARAAIGAPFRLPGRDPASGLDCVGLAAWAFGTEAPGGYALRSGDVARVRAVVAGLGLVEAAERRAGGLLLLRVSPAQLHLAIDSGSGIIHADAMLRRVVERPGEIPWPVIARWASLTASP
jgi:cell wall-associated NlpC family hydrolase